MGMRFCSAVVCMLVLAAGLLSAGGMLLAAGEGRVPTDIAVGDAAADIISTTNGGAVPDAGDAPLLQANAEAHDVVQFNRDVRPILSNHCYACHGFDPAHREADMRLDTFEGATERLPSGNVAIVPGDPDASEIIRRVVVDDHRQMPPPEMGKRLTEEEIATLRRWIEQGAVYQEHWSFIPPQRPALPKVELEQWIRNPIDRFVLAELEAQGHAPSPEADRATLIRRVTYDLTGLPPTPEEVDAFLADERDDAYERLVDRLLDSPRYGEHMTRYWLDAGRYGDTHALHLDNERYIWRWRDWVIEAYNSNMPFDQFTIEQLAGDLLPDPTLDQLIATGFNRNNPTTNEGGAIEEEYRVKYGVDRVDTTATVWLGVTMACAQCHDHKYDPITQKEYFEFFAFFNSLTESPMDGNVPAPPPYIKAPLPEQTEQLDALQRRVAELEERLHTPSAEAETAQAKWEQAVMERLSNIWQVLEPQQYTTAHGTSLRLLDDHSLLAEGTNPDKDIYEIVAGTDQTALTAIRLEALTHPSLPHGGPGRAHNANLVVSEVELEIAPASDPENFTPVRFASASADHEQPKFPVSDAINGRVRDGEGWAIEGFERREDRTAILTFAEPIGYEGGTVLRFRVRQESRYRQHTIGRLRLAISTEPTHAPAQLGDWSTLGTFRTATHDRAHSTDFGPEASFAEQGRVDRSVRYGNRRWRERDDLADGSVHRLSSREGAIYLTRTITVPSARELMVSLGTGNSFKLWLNGELVATYTGVRQAAADQHMVSLQLQEGENHLLLKVSSTRYGSGVYFRPVDDQTGPVPTRIAAILAKAADARSDEEARMLRAYHRRGYSEVWRKVADELAMVRLDIATIEESVPLTLVMEDMPEPRDTFLLIRGEYDQPGEQVYPNVPAALPPMTDDYPRNRLGLAQWLVDGNNPLTARVAVNRYWARYFGRGIVATVEDLGSQGDWPSHPELLDWLATEFVDSGWDIKHMQRLIVTSATYRQSSRITPELLRQDPDNRLLARASRHRLDGEAIRDTALAVSGLLVEQLGGPGYRAYQPEGIWEAVSYPTSNTARFQMDEGEVVYRRSMYMFWKRTAPPPNLTAFDAPDREACTVQRAVTNTPLQALVLLNDPQFVEAARVFAQRILRENGGAVDDRIRWAFRMCTARHPSEEERSLLRSFYEEQLSDFRQHPERARELVQVGDAPVDEALEVIELAAWTAVANLLFNLDETITRP